jgi:hypothetical protein
VNREVGIENRRMGAQQGEAQQYQQEEVNVLLSLPQKTQRHLQLVSDQREFADEVIGDLPTKSTPRG